MPACPCDDGSQVARRCVTEVCRSVCAAEGATGALTEWNGTCKCSGLKGMRCITLPPVACPAVQYFSTLTRNRYDFRGEKMLTTKFVF